MLSADDFPVEQEDFDNRLAELLDSLDRQCTAEDNPPLVIVVGQPSSGKTRLIGTLAREHGGFFASADSDELRLLHPRIDEIIAADPIRMDVLSNKPVGAWTEAMLNHARENKYPTMLENTLTKPEEIRTTAREFIDSGYRVEVAVLAAPAWISRLGIVERYIVGRDHTNVARWTTELAHTRALENSLAGLPKLTGRVDTFRVFDRESNEVYTGPDGAEAADVVAEYRSRWLNRDEEQRWWATYERLAPRIAELDHQHPNLETLLQRLDEDVARLRALRRE